MYVYTCNCENKGKYVMKSMPYPFIDKHRLRKEACLPLKQLCSGLFLDVSVELVPSF